MDVDVRLEERYQIGACLASGGMADVFEAHDRLLDRRVAIKRPKQLEDVPKVHARFLREARVLAGFSHPNAVGIFDAGEDADGPYIVMELVTGEPVSERLHRDGPMAVTDACRIADRVLAALGAAHRVGIVHRDVKPANVILAEDGTVKLADFGIAKVVDGHDPDLTTTSHVIGTWRYLAPEVAAGASASVQSDVYGVGLLLREMLLGVDGMESQTSGSADATVAATGRTLVAPVGGVIAPRLRAVLDKALATEPAERFPDAASMRAALREAMTTSTRIRRHGAAGAPVPLPRRPEPERPAEGATARPRAQSPWWPLPVLLAALAVVALVLALAGVGGSGSHPTTTPSTAVTPPSTVSAPTTAAAPVSAAAPTHAPAKAKAPPKGR